MAKKHMSMIGGSSFMIGLILAAIIALFSSVTVPVWSVIVIAILGIVVGLLNVADNEVKTFLLASIAFLISFQSLSAIFTTLTFGWSAIATFFNLISIFVAPAAGIVAIKALFVVSKN